MFSDTDISLADLRLRRDIASRDGDLKLAFACACAIDKIRYAKYKSKKTQKNIC
jgi:hypothetical protein